MRLACWEDQVGKQPVPSCDLFLANPQEVGHLSGQSTSTWSLHDPSSTVTQDFGVIDPFFKGQKETPGTPAHMDLDLGDLKSVGLPKTNR